ncbi:MFS transporter [Ktedonosporobacter rubrisoli]|uniref:MFS transporter n=1 Tax=Ktedonosporobacter rubrisoli TaxID=2509675 RepID=A0A4V0Z082_KTERU|nr:MFS transporter [Ktedonosporobacter rubrisoli]QBD82311.1 MFS transporter [Ktedonosporobacter rubrisoli]
MTTSTPSTAKNRGVIRPTLGQARFAFVVLLIINILNYADRSILSAIAPKLQADLHLTNTDLGLLASSFLFIYAIATLPIGIWADRGIRKNIVALCVGLWSIATALGGLTHTFIHLFLTRSVLGIGEAGYAPASQSLIGDYFPKSQRARVLSYWSVGTLIGTALGLVCGGLIAEHFGWRWAFFVVGIPGLLTALLIWRSVEPSRGAFDNDEEGGKDIVAGHGGVGKDILTVIKRIAKIPTYWILLVAFIFSFFTIGSAQFWIPTYFVRAFNLTVGQAASISGGVLAGGSLIGTLLGGWLADLLQKRRPQGRLIVATFALIVGSPLTLLALSIHEMTPFIIVFILAIVCLSLCLGPLNAAIQDIIAPEMRSTAIGVVLLLAHLLGDAASPSIVGAIADRTSLGFALIITAPICLLIAGLICLAGLRTVARDMKAMQDQLNQQHA